MANAGVVAAPRSRNIPARHFKLRHAKRPHDGLTLLELLIAIAILTMVVGTLAAVGTGVQRGFEHSDGHALATQHARVVLERITRTVQEATANEQFPGFIVLAERDGQWRFPDTLVVWRPSGAPADPNGLPRFNELVLYCPHPLLPNHLLELTVPNDTRPVPPVADVAAWLAEVNTIKTGQAANRVTLTNLLRTCSVGDTAAARWRGAIRFASRLRPSEDEWNRYKNGTLAWKDLSWVQGIYGTSTGLRQAWLRIELQLLPGTGWVANDPGGQRAIPFFGSAAVYYQLRK